MLFDDPQKLAYLVWLRFASVWLKVELHSMFRMAVDLMTAACSVEAKSIAFDKSDEVREPNVVE